MKDERAAHDSYDGS